MYKKLLKKNYNEQLELILEHKKYEEDTKSLLLTMLYKIEAAFNDYKIVKRVSSSQDEFIENIINLIDKNCKRIYTINQGTEESADLEEEKKEFIAYPQTGEIWCYKIEKALLNAIYKMDKSNIYISEKNDIFRNAIINIIKNGLILDKVEILQNFDGWSWNNSITFEKGLEEKLIFENLIMLLGYNEIYEILNKKNDFLEELEKKIKISLGEEFAKEFIKYMCIVAIEIICNKNSIEKNRILDEIQEIKVEDLKMSDKTKYLEDLNNIKNKKTNRIKEIDNILKNPRLQEQEFIKMSHKLSSKNEILSMRALKQNLMKEKQRLSNEITNLSELNNEENYQKRKKDLENKLEIVKNIEKNKNIDLYNDILNLQKVFINGMNKKIEKTENKKEIIDLIYLIRYYCFIQITKGKQIKEEQKLELENLEKKIIEKACNMKIFNIISKNSNLNCDIIKVIFETNIVKLENIMIKIEEKSNVLEIYDDKINSENVSINFEINARIKKKFKVFK